MKNVQLFVPYGASLFVKIHVIEIEFLLIYNK